ncbi:WbqC family protein [Paracoccaceae bacterium]|nr:WbqC family protein [Paracoccaceae bacterium]
MKKVIISQSNYIPWLGFFSFLNSCDEFIILDDVQFTRRDWRNRNLIEIGQKQKWLTIPLNMKGSYKTSKIMDMKVVDQNWVYQHINNLTAAYHGAPYWPQTLDILNEIYTEIKSYSKLTHINHAILSKICIFLEVKCSISCSTDFFTRAELDNFNANDRLIALANSRSASVYISGPSAKNYIEETEFQEHGIAVWFADYKRSFNERGSVLEAYRPLSVIHTLANFGLSETIKILREYPIKFEHED